MTKMNLERDL